MRVFELQIGDDLARWEVTGETGFGDDEVLLDKDDDLTRGMPWADIGYTIQPWLAHAQRDLLVQRVTDIVGRLVAEEGIAVPAEFQLRDYHHVVGGDAGHAKVVARTRKCFPLDMLPFSVRVFEDRVSEILAFA